MDREQILKEFDVRNEIIYTPGKFERAHFSAPYFYYDALNGWWETVWSEDELMYQWVEVIESDRQQFPEITERYVVLEEDSNGFVYVTFTNKHPEGEE